MAQFRSIPLGDIKLLQEIHREEIINSQVQHLPSKKMERRRRHNIFWLPTRQVLVGQCTDFAASVRGQSSDMTVHQFQVSETKQREVRYK
jgi:hypothetical protein